MGELFPFLTQTFEFFVMFIPHFVIVRTTHAGVKWTRGADIKVLYHHNGMWWPRWLFIPGLFRVWRWHQWSNWWRTTGIHWYWPLVTPEPTIVPIKRQTTYLPKQRLTTKDGKTIHLRGVVIYEISNVEALLTECYDYDDTSHDFSLVAIWDTICDNTYDQLVNDAKQTGKNLSKRLRGELSKFGIKIIRLSLADFATGVSLIHMTDIRDSEPPVAPA